MSRDNPTFASMVRVAVFEAELVATRHAYDVGLAVGSTVHQSVTTGTLSHIGVTAFDLESLFQLKIRLTNEKKTNLRLRE